MTERDRRCLGIIVEYHHDHGGAPSVRDLARLLGITSLASVARSLERLEREGMIRRDHGARAIAVLPAGMAMVAGRQEVAA